MRKFLIFLALCAICHAAPATNENKNAKSLTNVGPETVLHRRKRDEDAPGKPHSIQALEGLQHKPEHLNTPNVADLIAKPEKPDSIKAREGLQHGHQHAQVLPEPLIGHTEVKKTKRDSPIKPDSVKAQEGLQHGHHTPEPLIALIDEKKPKRDTVEVTDASSDKKIQGTTDAAVVVPHVDGEVSSTPHGPLRHRPVPVAELFNKPKHSSSSSSEESKETKDSKDSKESKESKETKA